MCTSEFWYVKHLFTSVRVCYLRVCVCVCVCVFVCDQSIQDLCMCVHNSTYTRTYLLTLTSPLQALHQPSWATQCTEKYARARARCISLSYTTLSISLSHHRTYKGCFMISLPSAFVGQPVALSSGRSPLNLFQTVQLISTVAGAASLASAARLRHSSAFHRDRF